MEEYKHHRITKETVDGTEIVFVDLEKSTEDEYLDVIGLIDKMSVTNTNDKYFFAINAYKAPVSLKIIESAKYQLISNYDSLSVTAIYGLNPFRRTLAKVIDFSNKNTLNLFDTRQEAVDFFLKLEMKDKLEPEKA